VNIAARATLTTAHLRLIEALATRDVQDYLREQALQRLIKTDERTKPALLPPAHKAA
jgi:hypothetical protein